VHYDRHTKLLSHGDNYKIPHDVHVNEFLIVFEKRILVPDMTPEPFDGYGVMKNVRVTSRHIT
jgi:hypothetical protein